MNDIIICFLTLLMFFFQLQVCSTILFSILFKKFLMLYSNTSLFAFEIASSEYHTWGQAWVLAEVSYNAVFSLEFFIHKQVKGEIGNYFRIFQVSNEIKLILHSSIAYTVKTWSHWKASRLGSKK